MNKVYRTDLDALKGIAIFAVVLFHCGLLATGYLGVDLFFVINGFLILPSLCKKIANHEFSFFSFLRKRVARLLPLIVIASAICLAIGYFVMLPDAYENLSESVVASNLMSENILEAITTKNYWDVTNDYKPLMHLWYVGILFQFYLIMPLLLLVVRFIAEKLHIDSFKAMIHTMIVLTLLSLLLYVSPIGSIGDKFYFIQFRLFEILAGGLTALIFSKIRMGGYLYTLTHFSHILRII